MSQADSRVLTVTLTPAMDVSISVPTLQPGHLYRLPELRQDPGGKGINVAKALHAFGISTLATGFLGGDRGDWISTRLTEQGIPHHFIKTASETRMNVKVSEADGRLTEFNTMSSEIADEEWNELKHYLAAAAKPGEWMALCGRLPGSADPHWYEHAIRHAHAQDIQVLLDSSGPGLKHGIMAMPEIVKPNRQELGDLVGERLETIEEVHRAAESLLALGVKTVVVSLGDQGLLGLRKNEVVRVQVPVTNAVSSVGAGDTVVAGLLYGMIHHLPFAEMLRFAAAAGTAAVKKPGTKPPDLKEVESIFAHSLVV